MSRTILMLEHDEDDRYITQTVFDENKYQIKLDFVTTSDALFAHLSTCLDNGKYPSLILLNYHAAPSNAVSILTELKSDKSYKQIPVIVLSGSVKSDIIKECYDAGAVSFIQKPWKTEETNFKISNFLKYWFETVQLP